MKTTIYLNPECSKCKEALCMLEDRNEEIEIIRYLETPPSKKELQQLISQLGITAEQLVRKSEPVYLELFSEGKYSDEEWLEILASNPILIQRQIVTKHNKDII